MCSLFSTVRCDRNRRATISLLATALASSSVHVWRLKGGMVASFQAYHGDDHEADEFWS
jgi:hypothetical protein